jgi:hypothetical protein
LVTINNQNEKEQINNVNYLNNKLEYYKQILLCYYYYTGYFTSDNELADGIENAIHNTFPKKKLDIETKIFRFFGNVLWVAFSIPSDSLSLVKYSVLLIFDKYFAIEYT